MNRSAANAFIQTPLGVVIVQVLSVIALAALWQMLAQLGVLNPFYYGKPSQVFAYALTMTMDGSLLSAAEVTMRETLAGFSLGVALGTAGGFALWWSPTTAAVLEPFLVALQAVPKVIFAPIFIVIIGVGFWFKVTVSFAAVVMVALINTYAGTREADVDLLDLLRSLGANRWQMFCIVVVPTALPWIVTSMEINVGFALVGAVVAEFISSNEGLGYLAMYAAGTFDMSLVLVPVMVLTVIAAAMYAAVLLLEKWLLPWLAPKRDAQWAV